MGRGYFIVFTTCLKSESKKISRNVQQSENKGTKLDYPSIQKSENPLLNYNNI